MHETNELDYFVFELIGDLNAIDNAPSGNSFYCAHDHLTCIVRIVRTHPSCSFRTLRISHAATSVHHLKQSVIPTNLISEISMHP
jgi:hypothetical protein